jgi:GT2 family glycosyltransferase
MNLSVVIPVYNGAKTIVNAVKSVVEQKNLLTILILKLSLLMMVLWIIHYRS